MKIKFFFVFALVLINCCMAQGGQKQSSGGEVVYGIAAKYPGDEGIGQDETVLFHDDFESGRPGWRWDHTRGIKYIYAETAPDIARGRQSAKFVLKKGRNIDTTMWKWLPGQDELYMRCYVRYGEDFGFLSHGGGAFYAMSDYRFGSGGHAGRAPTGDEAFWGLLEPSGMRGRYPSPGALNFYVYWWKMKAGSTGRHFGNRFITEPLQIPQKSKWICIEWRLKVNTIGKDDGELQCWVDGVGCGEFGGINWRSVESLKVNQVDLSLYLTWEKYDVTGGGETRTVWHDDVVLATEYIGPKVQKNQESKGVE